MARRIAGMAFLALAMGVGFSSASVVPTAALSSSAPAVVASGSGHGIVIDRPVPTSVTGHGDLQFAMPSAGEAVADTGVFGGPPALPETDPCPLVCGALVWSAPGGEITLRDAAGRSTAATRAPPRPTV